MPMFALISGRFSKPDTTAQSINHNISRLLIPLIIFQVLYKLPLSLYEGRYVGMILQPYWMLWYLLALFFWKAMLPYFSRLKHPMIIALLIALAAGYAPRNTGYFLSISRTITFFPFFLAGFYFKDEYIAKLTRGRTRIIAVALLILGLALSVYLRQIDNHWFFGNFSYIKMGHTEWYATAYRCLAYIASITIGLSFMSLVPLRALFITRIGVRSFQVYILHGFLRILFKEFGAYTYLKGTHALFSIPSLFIISVLVTLVLSTEFVAKYTAPLFFSQRLSNMLQRKHKVTSG